MLALVVAGGSAHAFLGDLQAQVVESVPGLVRVLLRRARERAYQVAPNKGFLARLGLAKEPALAPEFDEIDLEVHMRKPDPARVGKLLIEVRFRPAKGGPLPDDPNWHAWCDKIHADLGGYLMAKII